MEVVENRGGAREGAGRKPKTEKHETAIASAENRLADRLPDTLQNLEDIADGKTEDWDEQWVAAGMATIGKGNNERLAFPELVKQDPLQLVLVSKKVTHRGPDVRANMYLSDRVMGKPADGDLQKVADLVGEELNVISEKIRSHFEPAMAENILQIIGNADNGGPDSTGKGLEGA